MTDESPISIILDGYGKEVSIRDGYVGNTTSGFIAMGVDASNNAQQLLVDTSGNQLVKLTDGTNNVSVKGASASASSGDKSLVVTMHPSSNGLAISLSGSNVSSLNPLPVDIGVIGTVSLGNDVAHDAVDGSTYPHKIGFRAINALPTAVSNADRANGVSDLYGRQLTSHIDPTMQVAKAFNATSTQTGATIWDPTSGKKIAITSIVVGTYGTTAARLILWFGDNADTTYSAGTDQLVFAASYAPSATAKPGTVFNPAVPMFCTTADRELHITTDAGISVDVSVYGYEWA